MVPTFRQSVSVVILFVLSIGLILSYDLVLPETPAAAQSVDVVNPTDIRFHITHRPVVDEGGDVVYAGEIVTFIAHVDPPLDQYTFVWSMGDGSEAKTVVGTNSITHVYSSTGSKEISVIVNSATDSGSNSYSINVRPRIASIPTPVAPVISEITVDLPVNPDETYTVAPSKAIRMIAGVQVSNGVNYEWWVDRILVHEAFEDPNFIHQFTTSGRHTIQLITSVQTEAEPLYDSKEIYFIVTDESISGLRIIADSTIVEGRLAIIGATVKSGTNVEYSFDFGNGESTPYRNQNSAETRYTWVPNSNNESIIRVKARNSATVNPVQVTACIVVQPAPIIDLNVQGTGYVPNTQIPFNISAFKKSGQVANYVWSSQKQFDNSVPGGVGIGSAQSFTHVFNRSGVYLITLVAYGPESNVGTCTNTVLGQDVKVARSIAIVNATQADGEATLGVGTKTLNSVNNDVQIEARKQISFTVEGLNAPRYEWNFGDGTVKIIDDNATTHTYLSEGLHVLRVKTLDVQSERAFYAIVTTTGTLYYLPASVQSPNVSGLGSVVGPVPTSTSLPIAPTNTPVRPTNTPISPTSTPVPPPDVPTATDVPTDTPTMIPTNTAEATATLSPTPVPPTATPEPPTATATPTAALTSTPTSTSTSIPENTSIPTITPIPTSSLLKPTPIPTSTRAP